MAVFFVFLLVCKTSESERYRRVTYDMGGKYFTGNQRLECLLVTDDRLQSDVPKHEQQPDELFSTPVALRLAADHENWTGNQL